MLCLHFASKHTSTNEINLDWRLKKKAEEGVVVTTKAGLIFILIASSCRRINLTSKEIRRHKLHHVCMEEQNAYYDVCVNVARLSLV